MSVSKQSKRKQIETEDYDNYSDSENEFKKSSSSNRNSKKKKLISESELESDSPTSEISESEDINSETSDEDKPIKKILEKSKLNENSEKMNILSASSDDEPLITKTSSPCSASMNNSSNKSEPKKNGIESYDSGDDEIPISKVIKTSNMNGKSKKMNILSDSSDDEPLITKTSSTSESIINSSNKSEQKKNEIKSYDSDDDDIPISKVVKTSGMNGKSKKMNMLSDSSDDEPLITKTSSTSQSTINSSNKSEPKKNEIESFDSGEDDEIPVSKVIKTSDMNGKSKNMNILSASSDDEPLITKTSSTCSASIKNSSNKSEPKKNGIKSYDSGDDDILVSKVIKTPDMNGKSKKMNILSDSSDDEPLITKTSSTCSESIINSSNKFERKKNGIERCDSFDDDIPIRKVIKTSDMNGKSEKVELSNDSSTDEILDAVKLKKRKSGCSSSSDDDKPLNNVVETTTERKHKQNKALQSDSDDEPLAAKTSIHHKSKKQKNGSVSSDEDQPLRKFQKTSDVKNKKAKSSSNDRVEHLKKYLRLSGIHVQSYDKLFADCKSIKAKTEKLLSILHEKGMKGRPTIEKCKKLRKKIETKKEISELDMSNIIHTEGRSKRGSSNITQKVAKVENSPAEKRFSRLKDIIDSEESD